jgi:hypothetical protein
MLYAIQHRRKKAKANSTLHHNAMIPPDNSARPGSGSFGRMLDGDFPGACVEMLKNSLPPRELTIQ